MSIKVMTWVWEHSWSRLSDRMLLLVIADAASDDGRNAYPSIDTMVWKTNLSEAKVHASIKALVTLGELEYDGKLATGVRKYRVIMKHRRERPPRFVTDGDNPSSNGGPNSVPPQKVAIVLTPESAGVQTLDPADTAPLQNLRGPDSGVRGPKSGVETPKFGPVTVLEPSLNLKTQTPAADAAGDGLFEADEIAPPSPPAAPAAGKPKSEVSEHDPDWRAFAKAYPRMTAARAARQAWPKAVAKVGAMALIEAARRLASDPNLPETVHIPHPATWLNGERWNDPPCPVRIGSGAAPARLSVGDSRVASADELKARLRQQTGA